MDPYFPSLAGQGAIAIDCETYDPGLKENGPGYHRDDTFIVGIAVGTEAGFRQYYPLAHETGGNLPKTKVLGWLKKQMALNVPKVGANLLYDLGFLQSVDIHPEGPFYDIQIAEPLLNENRFNYSLETLAKDYEGEGKFDEELDRWLIEKFGKKNPKSNIWRAPPSIVAPYAISDIDLPLRIFAKQKEELEKQNLWNLFILESKLIPMLLAMRIRGVRVDLDKTEKMNRELTAVLKTELNKIWKLAKQEVSVWAAKDLAVLFDTLGVQYPLTPKTKQPSMTATWLERCGHPIAEQILEVRKLDKLCGTFLQGCILESHYKGRIHCQFNQLKGEAGGTVSGRFSCVAGWTPIRTPQGEIPINCIVPGDMVWTHRERWRPVTHTWLKGEEQMLDIRLSNGRTLTCTRKHRLLTNEGWKTVGEIYERFQKVDQRSGERKGCLEIISPGRSTNAENCPDTRDDLAQRRRGDQRTYDPGRTESLRVTSPLRIEDQRPEWNAGEIPGPAPQLDRRMQCEERIQDNSERRLGTGASASLRISQIIRNKETSEGICDPSYRRGYNEQSSGQSGDCKPEWSYENTCYVQRTTIEKIEVGQSYPVYDITVAEDESYEACGVFSHNSSSPNLQFIPTRTELGKQIRSLFLPDEGQTWWKKDYSQIEYRLMVHDAAGLNLPGAKQIVEIYLKDPKADFHQAVADMTGLDRGRSKTINFGLAYGEGVPKLAAQLGLSIPDAEALLKEYHRRAPFMKPLSQGASAQAGSTGVITTLFGRKRRFDAWEITKWNKDGTKEQKVFPHRVPGSRRAFTHKALNARIQGSAADIMKKAMVDVWESGVCEFLGVPQLTVHDELDGSKPKGAKAAKALKEVTAIMERTAKLRVPLLVDSKEGETWGALD